MFFWRRRHQLSADDLSAYIDGQLDASAGARLEAHVEECAACREALGELRAVRQVLRELPQEPVPRSFALRHADLPSPETLRPVGASGQAPALLGGLATAAFLAFGVLVGVDVVAGPSTQDAGDSIEPAMMRSGVAADEDAVEDMAEQAELAAGGNGEPAAPGDETADGDSEPLLPNALPEPEPTAGAFASEEPSPRAGADEDDGGLARLRVAEAAAAAVALVAGGSLTLVWWRRRA